MLIPNRPPRILKHRGKPQATKHRIVRKHDPNLGARFRSIWFRRLSPILDILRPLLDILHPFCLVNFRVRINLHPFIPGQVLAAVAHVSGEHPHPESPMETLIIDKLGSMKFATHNDVY